MELLLPHEREEFLSKLKNLSLQDASQTGGFFMNKLQDINTNKAPKAVGPYSQAIRANRFIFCSGQIGLDPKTNILVKGGIEKETEQVLKNLSAVLESVNLKLNNVVRVDIFLTNIKDFAKVNEVYATYFKSDPKPARQTIEVSNLPKEAHIELSCIAYQGRK